MKIMYFHFHQSLKNTLKKLTMKKLILFLFIAIAGISIQSKAQKWSDLTEEQKIMQVQSFRDDNQNYLKNTLKLSEEQTSDIDAVNICYLSTLDRIQRYGKTDADKEKYAKSITASRSAQLDAIMGVENRKKYQQYVQGKLKKAAEAMK